MHVVGLDHLVVNTQDLERALHFYHQVLGLERASDSLSLKMDIRSAHAQSLLTEIGL